jgi:hypothetical protein
MPDIPSFPAFDVTSKLQQQLEFNQTAGQGDPLVGTGASIVPTINVQQVTQSSSGTWSNLVSEQESPIKDQNAILSQIEEDRNSVISSYEQLAAVYDTEIANYNSEINQKKSEITSIQTTALGIGCSCLFGNADNINGVACGIGSTIRNDQSLAKIYTNITNYSANNPFKPISTQDLSIANFGKGFENVISNNTGTILTSNYGTVTGFAFTMVGIVTTLVPSAVCAGYATSIDTLASEIAVLRGQRDQYLNQVNDLKNLKHQQEVIKWGNKQSETALQEYNTALQTAISSISQYLDDIVVTGLIVHYDSAEDYGIETVLESSTGINSITKWNNLAGDSLYANPQTSLYSINLDNSDGPSVVLNSYPTVTNQYFTIGDSYIGGTGELGIGNTSYAIEVWAKISSDTNLGISSTTNGACIVGINSVHGYGLQVYKPSGIRVSFGERGSGSLVNNTNLSTNTWYHIVGTNEAGVGSKIYINGVLDGTGSTINLVSSTNNLQFGYAPLKISQYFSGKLSIVRVYKKNLSESEVLQNYNAHKSRYGY